MKQKFPVKHLSYSSIRLLCTDQQLFFKKYIRKEFTDKQTASMLVGECVHYIMEYAVKEKTENLISLRERFFEEIVTPRDVDGLINWGEKTPESIIKTIDFAAQELYAYTKEMGIMDLIQEVEPTVLTPIYNLHKQKLPLPIKAKYDVLDTIGGIWDYKVVSKFTGDSTSPSYIVQAGIYSLAYFGIHKRFPEVVRFIEVKKAKNRDKSPQCRQVPVVITTDVLQVCLELYDRVVRILAGEPIMNPETGVIKCLPNFFGAYDYHETWNDFMEEVFNKEKTYNLDELRAMADIDMEYALDL